MFVNPKQVFTQRATSVDPRSPNAEATQSQTRQLDGSQSDYYTLRAKKYDTRGRNTFTKKSLSITATRLDREF